MHSIYDIGCNPEDVSNKIGSSLTIVTYEKNNNV